MKKFFAVALFYIFSMGAVVEASRNGVQFSTGGDLSYIHYTHGFGWAAGASIGFQELHGDLGYAEQFDIGLFARKNFKIFDKTFLGFGLWGQYGWATSDVEGFSISPYFIIDYHLNDNFVLNAGAEIVQFAFVEIADINIQSREYFKPFLSLTYLF